MKKSFIIISFIVLLIFSLLFVSAFHRENNPNDKIYLDEWLNNLWEKHLNKFSEIETFKYLSIDMYIWSNN